MTQGGNHTEDTAETDRDNEDFNGWGNSASNMESRWLVLIFASIFVLLPILFCLCLSRLKPIPNLDWFSESAATTVASEEDDLESGDVIEPETLLVEEIEKKRSGRLSRSNSKVQPTSGNPIPVVNSGE